MYLRELLAFSPPAAVITQATSEKDPAITSNGRLLVNAPTATVKPDLIALIIIVIAIIIPAVVKPATAPHPHIQRSVSQEAEPSPCLVQLHR